MARVMSFIMAVFIIVPALTPAIGQAFLWTMGWRSIFWMLFVTAILSMVWYGVRHPESLAEEHRRSLKLTTLWHAFVEVLKTRASLGYTLAVGFVFAPFVAYLSSAQQIFEVGYGIVDEFPLYFAALALAIGLASAVNARLVKRFGMQKLATFGAFAYTVLSIGFLIIVWFYSGRPPLVWLMICLLPTFFCIGLMFGNLNALAMAPLGHIAGMGAAVVASLSTFTSVPLGAVIARGYDGQLYVWVIGFVLMGIGAVSTIYWARK